MSTYTLCPESASTFQSLLDRAEPGDRFVLTPGIYRGAWRLSRSGVEGNPIVIEAAAPGSAVITGADLVTGWEPDPEIAGGFRVALDLSALPPSNKHGLLAGRREQLFVDGIPLLQVLNVEDQCPGCFLYKDGLLRMIPGAFTGEFRGDSLKVEAGAIVGGGEKILSRNDAENVWPFLLNPFVPAEHLIETTTRCEIFATGSGRDSSGPAHIEVRGLVFRASGDAPQQPMVRFCGQHLLIEDCLFEYGAARGFDLRCDHSVMRRCVTRLNGQMGFSGYGNDVLMEDCALLHNNTKHSTFVCFEQGGCKICRASNWTVRRVRCSGNDGPGIWFDIDNHDNVIEACWCEGNSGPGIMYEISWDAVIRNNVCVRNGFAQRKDQRFDSIANSVGHLEPVYGQGILVQMSRNVRVHNNTCVGNRRCGIELRHHPYQQAGNEGHSKDIYRLRDNEVFNNLLADNDWNNLMVSETPQNPLKAGEVLDNHHDHNLFHNSSALLQHGGNLSAYCRWGKTQHAGSMSLEEWRACRHQDLNSIQWDPMFVAPAEGDFRLEPQSPACGRGRPVEGFGEDYRGQPRPDRPAIGAFEALVGSAAEYLKTCCWIGMTLLALSAGVPRVEAQTLESRVVTPRAGLPNAAAKLAKGGELRVVFLGGSITQGGGANGYVATTEAWLKSTWPDADVKVFNAGISGTDSAFGAKRYERDVLVHKPDLVLVEFAVNDGDRDHTAHMERIVHKTWTKVPECDLVFFYTLSKGHLGDYQAGRLPRAASFHEAVAEHYGIPTIGLAHAVAAKVNAGEIEWKAFANDAVHPHAEGYRFFTETFQEVLPTLLVEGAAGPHRMKDPLTAGLQVYPPAIDVAPLQVAAFVSTTGEKAVDSFAIPVPALHWIENNSFTTEEGKTLWRLHWMEKKRSGAMDETIGATKADWAKNDMVWFAEDRSFTGPEGNALFAANDKGVTLGFSGKEVGVLVFVAPETGRYAFRLSVGALQAWQNEETEFALQLLRFGWGQEQGESLFHYRVKRKDAVKAGHEGELDLVAGEEIAMVVGSNSPGFIRGAWQSLRLDIGRMAPK